MGDLQPVGRLPHRRSLTISQAEKGSVRARESPVVRRTPGPPHGSVPDTGIRTTPRHAMPELPDPPPSQPALLSAESASPSLPSQHHGDEASVRLLLEALVRRLQRQPLELAERALGCGGGRLASEPPASPTWLGTREGESPNDAPTTQDHAIS